MSVLSVHNIAKAYYQYRNEWQRISKWFGFSSSPIQENWVLKHINFSLNRGETVGLVGQNGAGKSTLMKIITGTLKPNKGSVHINGRVAAMLELGMGFNPERSGEQNAYHALGLMGFNAKQIENAIDKIKEFAEIGDYFNEPIRTYSSGMQARLAFSVATVFRPEILIVDEILSVGDTYFQHKSFDRIRQFQKQGTTLLIVSHSRSDIQNLCNRAILLEKGHIIKDGQPEAVMDFYNATLAEKNNASIRTNTLKNGRQQTTSGTGEAKVIDITLLDSSGKNVEFIEVGEPVTLRLEVEVYKTLPKLVMGFGICDRLGQVIFGTNTHFKKQILENVKKGTRVNYFIDFPANFGPGSYSVRTALHSSDSHLDNNYEWRDLAFIFNVVNSSKPYFDGCAWINPVIRIKQSSTHPSILLTP